MIFSPHTFELSINLSQVKYDALRSLAYVKSEGSHRIFKTDNKSDYCTVHVDEALSSCGIKVEYHDNFSRYRIKFIVNPSKVLGGDDVPKLWKPTDRNIKVLIRTLKAHIKDYFESEYMLNDFSLTRIDFTANVDVGNRENVSNYIKVLYNLGRVKGFAPKYKKSDKRIDRTLSFDLKGKSRNIEFSAYDKEAQSKKKAAKGILRIEIRLMKVEVKNESDIAKQIKQLSKRSKEIFMNFFQMVVPRGDYYCRKQVAILIEDNIAKIVTDKRARENMLGKMNELLELIPIKKSLYLAQKAMNYRHIDRVMETFAELNVSPVTLSKNMKMKHLKSLYSYMEE